MHEISLIDTHVHLDFDRFDGDRPDVIRRALDADVMAMVTIGIDYKSSLKAIEIAEDYANVFAAVGVHPHDAKDMTDEQFEAIAAMLSHPKVVAIGEVGLDYHYDYSPRDLQRRIFRQFLDLSLTAQMPLIIHTRESDEDVLELIQARAKKGWRGVFHCFAGDARMAHKVIELGFLLSFTGNITFKNSNTLHVMAAMPLDKLMVETDSPFMAPAPFRGKRNEPAYVRVVAQKIAEVKEAPLAQVAQLTTQNALTLFGLHSESILGR
ncbi:TatD family hydrolase [candidate division KSB1 bacterium]|nr:TatD family hydrolase [candidate division KSB1 bacterium]RQW08953.1 MAG: TatD family deoxyribonuclease [candidate division KSB1 bacterium]